MMVGSRPVNEPQLKIRTRRWRRYQPTINLVNDDGDCEVVPGPSSRKPSASLTKRVGIEFINASHPRDATSATAVSNIRSHVARGIHASRRASTLPPCMDLKSRATRVGTGRVFQLAVTWPASLKIPPLEAFFQGIRPITRLEHFLLDYYVKDVIPESRNWCNHGEGELLFYESTKQHWLPFVVSDTGLLAGVMLSACRNLALHERRSPIDCDVVQVATMYKLECIRSVNTAIAVERCSISNASIAKAMMLCTDEALCKNITASIQHYEGMSQMIRLKGGLPNLGVDGFLSKAVKGCNVYEYFGIEASL
ncbi:hypothetical protein V8C42DRAFT_274805 [Trichoderma barbatum]